MFVRGGCASSSGSAPVQRSSAACRCSTSTARSAPGWARSAPAPRWCWPACRAIARRADRRVLAIGRAPSRQLLQRGTDDLRRAARRADRPRRRQFAALRHLRRGTRCRQPSSTASNSLRASVASEGYGLTEATCASCVSPPSRGAAPGYGRTAPARPAGAGTILGAVVDGDRRVDVPPRRRGRHALLPRSGGDSGLLARRDNGEGVGSTRLARTPAISPFDGDAYGFIRLTGRAKDLIIRGGHNIDPRLIEDALVDASGGGDGGGGRPAGCLCRRTADGLRGAAPGPVGVARGTR